MKKLYVLLFIISVLPSCIALKKDLDIAKEEIRAESSAKRAVFEQSLKKELKVISKRLNKIEKKLALDKKKRENQISMSFSNIDELRSTIMEITNRIDTVDLNTHKNIADTKQLLTAMSEQMKIIAEEIESIKQDAIDKKPVENVTVDKKSGKLKLPDDAEKAYRQLVDLTRSGTEGTIIREGWEKFEAKFKKSKKCDVTYWRAESYYMEKDYNSAIAEFRKIEKDFKKCSKLEASYLRIVYSLYYIEKKALAKKIYKVMKKKFPKTSFPKKVKVLKKLLKVK